MTQRNLAFALLLSTIPALGLAAPSAGGLSSRRTAPGSDDPASVSAFVSQLRAHSETTASAPRSLQEAVSGIVPDLPGFPRCLTPVILEVGRQAEQSPALASFAALVLSPPALAKETASTTPDGHFTIHFTTDRSAGHGVLGADRDGNGSPDYVDQVAAALTAARQRLLGRLGYRDPETRGPIDVFLANLGGRVDGYTPRQSFDRPSYLVIDSRLLGNDALLRAAVAHQYAHAVLDGYSSDAPIWWVEATASWLEGVIVGSYAHYAGSVQGAIEQSAAGLGGDQAPLLQGRLLWPAYLSSVSTRGSLVRDIWELLDRQGSGADLWLATEQVLRSAGMSLEETFSEYALWLLLSGERSDGRHFPFAERLDGVSYSGSFKNYPAAEIQALPMLAPFGVSFVRLGADGAEGGLRLRFEGDSPGLFQAQLLLTPRKEGAPLLRVTVAVDSRGHGSIGIPWATFSEAVLIVGNVVRSGEPAPYSFIARPDPSFPFELTSFTAEPDGEDVRITWETRSEDGLFGWVVYRSEQERDAPHRVNDVIVPAIGDGDGPVAYQYLDHGVFAGRTYHYSLVGVTRDGLTREIPRTRVDIPR